ncbi:MAG: response regulator [Magnetococcales bacterium]|nr:response regulator [Magnetococcales bacterium]
MNKPLDRILYAEDEPDIQEVAVLALETVGGFNLKICNSGKEALDAAAEYQPDLLLFDVMMPEMDGPTALKEIRSLPGMENIPVIFMTAKVQPEEIAHYKDLGAIDVIPKPFDPMSLADAVRDCWNKI